MTRVIFHLEQEIQDQVDLLLINLQNSNKSSIYRDCIRIGLPILEKRLKASAAKRKVK